MGQGSSGRTQSRNFLISPGRCGRDVRSEGRRHGQTNNVERKQIIYIKALDKGGWLLQELKIVLKF